MYQESAAAVTSLTKKLTSNIFTVLECAKTIGNAKALMTNPIVRKIETSWQELELWNELDTRRRDINVGISENI